jgi:hypothetical protein
MKIAVFNIYIAECLILQLSLASLGGYIAESHHGLRDQCLGGQRNGDNSDEV